MAHAFCPVCRSSFRYKVQVPPGPAWLKNVARIAGRGEQAAMLCYGCWVPLLVGDVVTILYSGYSLAPAGTRAKGVVVEIATSEEGKSYYAVEALEDFEGLNWCYSFWRTQLRADKPQSSTTAQLSLP